MSSVAEWPGLSCKSSGASPPPGLGRFLAFDDAGFELRWLWYLSVVAITLQMALSLLLLRREFRLRLGAPAAAPAAAV